MGYYEISVALFCRPTHWWRFCILVFNFLSQKMLTALVHDVRPNVKNVWSCWINHLTKDREKTGIRDAALVTKQGSVSSHTPQFKLSVQDIQVAISTGQQCQFS